MNRPAGKETHAVPGFLARTHCMAALTACPANMQSAGSNMTK